MDLQAIKFDAMDWIHLAGDRDQWWPVMEAVRSFHMPEEAENFLTSHATINFSMIPLRGVNYLVKVLV
jgi:hypothetical protein